jgi:hypothetical protein
MTAAKLVEDFKYHGVPEKLDSINVAALIGDKEPDCAGNLVGRANPFERGCVALSFEECVPFEQG